MLVSKKGMSALQIYRTVFGEESTSDYTRLGICVSVSRRDEQRAWGALMGNVEVDETWIGGKEKNKHLNKTVQREYWRKGQYLVIGAIARKGNVVCASSKRQTGHA